MINNQINSTCLCMIAEHKIKGLLLLLLEIEPSVKSRIPKNQLEDVRNRLRYNIEPSERSQIFGLLLPFELVQDSTIKAVQDYVNISLLPVVKSRNNITH